MRVEGQVLYTGFVSNVIEVNVAGLNDALVERDGAVHAPAFVVMPVKTRAAGAMEQRVFVDRAGFEAGERYDRLEGGTRRKLGLNGAGEQWVARIIREFLPVR